MSYFDIEDCLDSLETFLKNNLNTQITTINAQRENTTLSTIDNSAYYKQFIDAVPNYDPFVLFGVQEPSIATADYPSSIETYVIDIIVFFQRGDSSDDYRKAFRYRRAIRDLISDNFNGIFRQTKFSVTGLTPATVQISRKSHGHRATGVSVSVTLN